MNGSYVLVLARKRTVAYPSHPEHSLMQKSKILHQATTFFGNYECLPNRAINYDLAQLWRTLGYPNHS